MSRSDPVALGVGAVLLGVIALHLIEPPLAITWSHAHLAREGWRIALAIGLTLLLPALGAVWWTQPGCTRPLGALSGAQIAVGSAGCVAGLALIGGLAPAPWSNYDSVVLLDSLRGARDAPIRWMLGVHALQLAAASFANSPRLETVVASANSAFAAVGVVGLIAAARALARTRGEAVAIGLLALSAFGTSQIAIGYIEIYPIALGLLGLYIGLASRVLRGGTSLVPCAVVAALAPFFYIGLSLLLPSTLVLTAVVARRETGARQLGIAAGCALVAAGLATLPEYGVPFAWLAFATDAAAASQAQFGLNLGSSLLPLAYMFSTAHLAEVAHSLLLIDAVGWTLLLGPGLALVAARGLRAPDPLVVFLLAIALPYAAYAFAMDPIFGAYLDWDLWATGAPAVSLLGAWAFVVWGRERPVLAGALLGLALACASVHALARFHAMPLDTQRHLRESPYHVLDEASAPTASRLPTQDNTA